MLRDADIARKDFDYFLAMKVADGCGKAKPDVRRIMFANSQTDLSDFKSMLLAAQTSRADQRALNTTQNLL